MRSPDVTTSTLAPVPGQLPIRAASRSPQAPAAGRSSRRTCGRASTTPQPTAGSGDVDVVHGTNYVVPPTRLPTVVSVYDCWFLRHPELATPLVQPGRQRAAARGGPRGLDPCQFERHRRRRCATCWPPIASRTVLLGRSGARRRPTMPGRWWRRGSTGGRSSLASAPLERRKNLPLPGRRRSARSPTTTPTCVLVARRRATATTRDAIDGCDRTRRRRQTQARVHRLGVVDDASKRWLLRHATRPRLPVARRGIRFPAARGDAGRHPGRGHAASARSPRSPATPPCSSTGATPSAFAGATRRSAHRRHGTARPDRGRRPSSSAGSRGRRRPTA